VAPAPRRSASGNPIRPAIILAMFKTQQAFHTATNKLDELVEVVTKVSQSGIPPPPDVKKGPGGTR
jgi:hypothetical protein